MWYVCAKVLFILYLLISAIKREPDLSEAGTGHCGYTCTTNYKILGLVFGRWELLLEGLLNLGYAWQDITYVMQLLFFFLQSAHFDSVSKIKDTYNDL